MGLPESEKGFSPVLVHSGWLKEVYLPSARRSWAILNVRLCMIRGVAMMGLVASCKAAITTSFPLSSPRLFKTSFCALAARSLSGFPVPRSANLFLYVTWVGKTHHVEERRSELPAHFLSYTPSPLLPDLHPFHPFHHLHHLQAGYQ